MFFTLSYIWYHRHVTSATDRLSFGQSLLELAGTGFVQQKQCLLFSQKRPPLQHSLLSLNTLPQKPSKFQKHHPRGLNPWFSRDQNEADQSVIPWIMLSGFFHEWHNIYLFPFIRDLPQSLWSFKTNREALQAYHPALSKPTDTICWILWTTTDQILSINPWFHNTHCC